MNYRISANSLLHCGVFALLTASASAASYFNDFNTNDAINQFTTESTDSQWSVVGGVYANRYANAGATSTNSSASVSINGVAGNNFAVSTQFSVASLTGPTANNNNFLGMAILSNTGDFSGNYYLFDFSYIGTGTSSEGSIRALRIGTGALTGTAGFYDGNATDATLAIDLQTIYTLRITGTYNAQGHLTLTTGLFNAAGDTQLGTSGTLVDTSPLTGTNFGYRNRTGGGTGTTNNVDFDNFSVEAVPEPSALALAGLSALGLLRRRR